VARSASARSGSNTNPTQHTLGLVRGDDREIIALSHGITVYPPVADGQPWRAVFIEDGRRRYRQAASESGLAEKLAKVTERLASDAGHMERPGADLVDFYLSPARHRADKRWSRKHADTQRRLCERFVAPFIANLICQDIKVAHMQRAVNAAPTAAEGDRLPVASRRWSGRESAEGT
jgi:hypothetical protein